MEVVNAMAGPMVALSSPPAALTANADTPLPFTEQVGHLLVQNNTATSKYLAFDAAATLGSYVIAAGQERCCDIPCAVLHIYSTTADNVNGSTSGNLVVLGWV